MTLILEPRIRTADGPAVDAFERWRVSEMSVFFDSKQLHDADPRRWAEKLENGGGSSWIAADVCSRMSVTTTGDRVVRQTRQRFIYVPGVGRVIAMTTVMSRTSVAAGAVSRLGVFDDSDGVFLELDGTDAYVAVRKNTSTSRVPRASWDDPLDGSGPSGVNVDFTRAQILLIDMQWLGVGRVRLALDIDGRIVVFHTLKHANVVDSVYMANPNLPARYELVSTGAARVMDHICVSVANEGRLETIGLPGTADRGASLVSAIDPGTIVPLMAIRLRATHLNASIVPTSVTVMSTTNADYRLVLLINPTIAGTDPGATPGNWVAVDNTPVEKLLLRTTANGVSGGREIFSDYSAGGNGPASSIAQGEGFDRQLRLGADVDGNRDEFVLAAEVLSGTNHALTGKIGFMELS